MNNLQGISSRVDEVKSQTSNLEYKETKDAKSEQQREKRIEKNEDTLAGVAQWTGCQPVNQRATCLIPNQGTRLGCGPGP